MLIGAHLADVDAALFGRPQEGLPLACSRGTAPVEDFGVGLFAAHAGPNALSEDMGVELRTEQPQVYWQETLWDFQGGVTWVRVRVRVGVKGWGWG